MNLKFYKVRPEAKLPIRAHKTDAGMDLFFCPSPRDAIPKQIESVLPHGSSLFPTGLKIEVPEGYMLEIKNKSGISSKRGLIVGACVVDRGYTGEIFVNLHNPSDRTQTLHAGDKISQAVFVKIETNVKPQVFQNKNSSIYNLQNYADSKQYESDLLKKNFEKTLQNQSNMVSDYNAKLKEV